MKSSRSKKVLLAACATLFALGLGEVWARMFQPPAPKPGSIYAAGGRRVPLGEIIHFMTRQQEFNQSVKRELDGPHGKLQTNLKLRMGFEEPKPRWDYFDENGCIAMNTNSLGFRDLEFTVEKQPQEYRIMALGDSFTYGQGVSLELTWPQALERLLADQLDRPVEVINAGFASGPGIYSPDGYDRWLESDGIFFGPDVVIVGLCLNDMGQVPLLSYPVVPLKPVAGGWSRLLDHLVRWWRQRAVLAEQRDLAVAVEKQPEAWNRSKAALLRIQELCKQQDVAFVVAVFPMLSELEAAPYRRLHEMAASFCEESGIRTVDLKSGFDGLNELDLWVHPTDQHPNHTGHQILAEGILDYLKAEGLLP